MTNVIKLHSLKSLELHSVEAEPTTYRGQNALRVVEQFTHESKTHPLVILTDTDFQDGAIETEIAGFPKEGAAEGMRGFVGIAFRVQPGGRKFESLYLRPTNGRADDQLRRNHATQYISFPDYPWQKLRAEHPGVYESYVDLVPGAWTKIKIVVSGQKAQLYVHGAEQPCLIVNGLKLPAASGQIALWVGTGTEAYFSELIIR